LASHCGEGGGHLGVEYQGLCGRGVRWEARWRLSRAYRGEGCNSESAVWSLMLLEVMARELRRRGFTSGKGPSSKFAFCRLVRTRLRSWDMANCDYINPVRKYRGRETNGILLLSLGSQYGWAGKRFC
jgi:hypothetical protein